MINDPWMNDDPPFSGSTPTPRPIISTSAVFITCFTFIVIAIIIGAVTLGVYNPAALDKLIEASLRSLVAVFFVIIGVVLILKLGDS
jgi:hypothetical protein